MNWKKNIKDARTEVEGGTRLVLINFYSTDDEGSMKMLNETLKDEKVTTLIEREAAPVLCNIAEAAGIAKEYRIDLTPTFVLADENGRELERWVGYLPAKEFREQLILSKGLAAFHLERHSEAVREFEELIEEFPDSELKPEAKYFLGAAKFKLTGKTDDMIDIYHTLMIEHPESIWAKRCSIWARTEREFKPFVNYTGGGSAGSGFY